MSSCCVSQGACMVKAVAKSMATECKDGRRVGAVGGLHWPGPGGLHAVAPRSSALPNANERISSTLARWGGGCMVHGLRGR